MKSHERRIAPAPVGKARQQPRIGVRLRLDDIEIRQTGPRLGDALPEPQADPRGQFVKGSDPHGIADAGRDDDRRVFRTPG